MPFYQYWFSKELRGEADSTERFPAQPEIERYLSHVCDKFDLRRHITFGARVQAQFIVFNTGGLSEPEFPNIPGRETFQGACYHTSRWPKDAIELKGKRAGVVGTAATGIQVVQTIAADVARLTVFQRTPNYAVPIKNPRITDADLANMRASREDLHVRAHQSLGGFVFDDEAPMFDDAPPEQREAHLRKLMPTTCEFGTRRLPLEHGYFDVFNRDNVELVDLREDAVQSIDATGVRTAARYFDLDVIIFATGFDAGVGSLNRIDVRGNGGVSLKQEWDARLRTTVGMQVHGFPNLFMTMAPFAPASAICNAPVCVDQQMDWICQAIRFVRREHAKPIEPTAATENAWMPHHEAISEPTLLGQNRNCWYRREGADGTKRELLAYMGGLAQYREACDAMRNSDLAGFEVR